MKLDKIPANIWHVVLTDSNKYFTTRKEYRSFLKENTKRIKAKYRYTIDREARKELPQKS